MTGISGFKRTAAAAACAAITIFSAVQEASAAVIRVDAGAFIAGSGLITFSEFAVGTVNASYSPATYGGDLITSPTVTFDGFFTGQSQPATVPPCPPGAALTGCVTGLPTGPISLAAGAPDTRIVTDGANPTSPVLSGTPTFNGSIAILFDLDVAGVGLDGGFFNGIGGTSIQAYARDGTLLGDVLNIGLGIEFLGLVTDDGLAGIAGLLFSLVGPEPAGFAIDNLRFGIAGEVVVPGAVPEPGSLALLAIGLLGFAGLRRRMSA